MRKKVGWGNLMKLASLGTVGALLAACANSIPNNTFSLVILAVGIVLTFGSSLIGLYLLKTNRV